MVYIIICLYLLLRFIFWPIVDLVFRSMAINDAPSPIANGGHYYESQLIAYECANFIMSRVEEDILNQDAPQAAPPAYQAVVPVASPAAPGNLSDEEEPAPPVILQAPASPEFNSDEDSDIEYVPPTPPSEDDRLPKRRLFVPETPSPKRAKPDESESEEHESEETEESDESDESDGEEPPEKFLFGPANPNSVPFRELNKPLYYDLAKICYDYFADFNDFFDVPIEDLRRMYYCFHERSYF